MAVFYTPIDMNLNEILNGVYQQLGTDPVSPIAGQFWWNTTQGRLKHYDGTAIRSVAVLNDLVNALKYVGGYDATGNTPNLVTPVAGTVLAGYTYKVTTAGTFFGEAVEIGDTLIANVNDPSAAGDWTVLQDNVDYATETVAGLIQIATQAIVDAGTNTTQVITPATLVAYLTGQGYTKKFVTTITGTGSAQNYTITHNLGSTDVDVQVIRQTDGRHVTPRTESTNANNVLIRGNFPNGVGFNVVVIG
jgi:hypothetical protein